MARPRLLYLLGTWHLPVKKAVSYTHLDVYKRQYQYTEENPAFANVLTQYLHYIAGLPGVHAVGQFDATGMYFSELKASEAYTDINAEIVEGGKYEGHANIAQLLSVDESLLSFVNCGITEYTKTASEHLPILALSLIHIYPFPFMYSCMMTFSL